MEGSRLQILQILQRNRTDTVDGLARAIGLAPATVQRHLDILQRDRLVAFTEVRKKTGRPEYAFYLTEGGQESLPKDYDGMLGAIVQELSALTADETSSRDGEDLLELVFARMGDAAARKHEEILDGKGMGDRLTALTAQLSQDNFFPETDIGPDGSLKISLLNCPFRAVAMRNKAVCDFDRNLIASLLKVPVTREQCISDGHSGCVYSANIAARTKQEVAPA
ncbi:MAG: ArsR family transcriptional regulator [SAR202 cluster bacterium]|nr:ArsR family transcriptional regulator [SAR202 cluster bacterium]